MSKQNGPRVRIDASCFDCEYERSERYVVQSDSGSDVYCVHPDVELRRRRVGDTTWHTPKWCPLLGQAIARLLEEHGRPAEGNGDGKEAERG